MPQAHAPRRIPLRTLLGMALLLLLGMWPGARSWAADTPLRPDIEVVGSAEVTARPDEAEVRVGVVTEAEAASAALEDNNRAMARLRALLAKRGLAERDIQTTRFNVMPRYHRANGAPARLVGYRVEHQLNLTVHRLQGLGGLLDAVVQNGANQITGIGFSVAKPQALLDEARRRAMADARHRAELYAAAARLRLGRVTYVAEQGTGGPRPLTFAADSLRAAPVAPGAISFRATVKVDFAAVPR